MTLTAVQQRIANLLQRMIAQGMGESMQIIGAQTIQQNGVSVARARNQLLGSANCYVTIDTGAESESQEGRRLLRRYEIYYVQDGSLLTEANASLRWIRLPNRHGQSLLDIIEIKTIGPYAIAVAELGGVTDKAGKIQ